MEDNEYEMMIMQLIVNAGDARSLAIQAVREARQENFSEARQLIARCEVSLNRAHQIQTNMIQSEARNEGAPVTLLMVHAQDHLMNAMTVKDLAKEMIGMMQDGKEGK